MRLEMGRVDHQRIRPAALVGQFQQHPGEDALVAPAFPAVVERLRRAIGRGRIAPAQAIAIDEDYPAKHALVVNTRLAVRLREERFQTRHLCVGQPEKIAHVTARFLQH